MLIEKLIELSHKENLVFVGSIAMMLQGIEVKPNDIDVVVTDLSGLENYIEYSTDSKFSFSGKRAFIIGEICIDIFIEEKLPEYVVINGLKCETFFYMERYYNVILESVDDHWKKVIIEKIKMLK